MPEGCINVYTFLHDIYRNPCISYCIMHHLILISVPDPDSHSCGWITSPPRSGDVIHLQLWESESGTETSLIPTCWLATVHGRLKADICPDLMHASRKVVWLAKGITYMYMESEIIYTCIISDGILTCKCSPSGHVSLVDETSSELCMQY